MPDFSKRSYEKELMDLGQFNQKDFRKNLLELKLTNQYLGGHKATLKALKRILPKDKNKVIHIADVACGGGDAMLVMLRYLKSKEYKVKITGIDLNPVCINYAKETLTEFEGVSFIEKPYQLVNEDFDIITCSLFTHHLNEEQIQHYLTWANKHSSIGFIINDLHRHPLAYWSIKCISQIFPFSYLYKNDAPLSVLRSFTKEDWLNYAQQTGIALNIKWNWAFRYSVCHQKI